MAMATGLERKIVKNRSSDRLNSRSMRSLSLTSRMTETITTLPPSSTARALISTGNVVPSLRRKTDWRGEALRRGAPQGAGGFWEAAAYHPSLNSPLRIVGRGREKGGEGKEGGIG